MSWLPSGMDLGSGLWSMAEMEFQQEANKNQRQFQEDQAQREFQYAQEMWEKTNTYNSPEEQMKRLQAAGLNPALMYGKGASPGIASPAPNINLSKEGHYGGRFAFQDKSFDPNLQGILNAYNDMRITNKSLEAKDAEIAYLQERTDNLSRQNAADWFVMTEDEVKALEEQITTGNFNKWGLTKIKQFNDAILYQQKAEKAISEAESARSVANFDNERWELYDKEGIFLDQMTNIGKYLEKRLGQGTGAVLDALLKLIK